eukprot:Clim_evm30s215 gene=Clim_evmTU30s215
MEDDSGPRITGEFLKKLCRGTEGLYGTPSLNDTLCLHYEGFSKIEDLEEYTGLKSLWLESNGLTKIGDWKAR